MRLSGKIRSIGATLALTAVMVLAACDAGGGGSTTSKSNDQLLKEAAKNMRELKSYTISVDGNQAGTALKMSGDIDEGNNNIRLDVESGGTTAKVIGIGEQYYVSSDNGATWQEMPAASAGAMTAGLDAFASIWTQMTDTEIDKVKDNLKDGGASGEVAGTKHITANAAELAAVGGSAGSAEGTMDMWISTDSPSYVKQLKMDVKSGGADIKATIKWDKFNETLDIQAPTQ